MDIKDAETEKKSSLKELVDYVTGKDLKEFKSFLGDMADFVDVITTYHDPYSKEGRDRRRVMNLAQKFDPFLQYLERPLIPLMTYISGATYQEDKGLSCIAMIFSAYLILNEATFLGQKRKLIESSSPPLKEFKQGNLEKAVEMLGWEK